MLLFVPVVLLAFWILFRHSRERATATPFILASLPATLFILSATIPIDGIQSIRAFQSIAAAGQGNVKTAGAVALAIATSMYWATIVTLVALAVAVVLQWVLVRRHAGAEDQITAPGKRPILGTWVIVASVLSVLPVSVLAYLTQGIASLIMQAAVELTSPNPPSTVGGMALTEFSSMLSRRLILASLGGGVLAVLMFASGITNVIAHHVGRTSPLLERASWAIAGLLGVMGLWNALDLAGMCRVFARTIG